MIALRKTVTIYRRLLPQTQLDKMERMCSEAKTLIISAFHLIRFVGNDDNKGGDSISACGPYLRMFGGRR
jgi:hypothetical protein